MSVRILFPLVLALALAGGIAGQAAAHEGGKAEPRIAAAISATGGLTRLLSVRLTDVDEGTPIAGATVLASAEMTSPHLMRTAPWRLPPTAAGVYQARVRFAMAARWSVAIRVSGEKVVPASSELGVSIARGAVSASAAPGSATPVVLPTRLEDRLTERDYLTMTMLWLHGLAALGWILGVVVITLALSVRPGVLAEAARRRLATAYRRWGVWAHWALVPIIVGTGIYNLVYVTPFRLVWRPSEVRELTSVPYGALYEAILIVKLGLFAALLITGTQLLLRVVRMADSGDRVDVGFARALTSALGPAGLFYLATVPLILAAAMALRYVHILSHVADVIANS